MFQSLWNRAVSFDKRINYAIDYELGFQSLWNRAVSFDENRAQLTNDITVSIPLEQGGVFRRYSDKRNKTSWRVSIPLEQGKVFRLTKDRYNAKQSFNPFRTGRGLSTLCILTTLPHFRCFNPFGAGPGLSTSKLIEKLSEDKNVSIPLEQGKVFRHIKMDKVYLALYKFQSL